jgi:hypothetical protein
MPNLSTLKSNVIAALRHPHDGSKLRRRRRVISFTEAFENLKNSVENGSVTCAAFHSFGRCRKDIDLDDSTFFANLDQLNMADVQSPIKLMPFMLCFAHWEKTVYHNALFLDWLSTYGSKQDNQLNQHFESIVIDYQSAIAMDNEENSLSDVPNSSKPMEANQGEPVAATDGPIKGML